MSFGKGFVLGLVSIPAIRASGKLVKKIRAISKEMDQEDDVLRRLQYHFDHTPGFEDELWNTDREIYWFLKHKQRR